MPRNPKLIVSSLVAHAIAVAALIIAGWWNIEKLEAEPVPERPIYIPARTDRPMPGGGDGKLPPLAKKRKGADGQTQQARKAVTDAQPSDLIEEDLDATGADNGTDDGTDDGSVWGHEYGDPDGTGKGLFIGTGDCRMPECGSGIPTDVELDDDDPPKDEIVTPDVMHANRKSSGKIKPPDSVKLDMVRAGETETRAALKICVTTAGKVRDVSFVKRTGYDAYDAKLVREIRKWEYQPFTIGGKAVPACSVTHIIFRMK